MTTLDRIAALTLAIHRNDIDATPWLLDELEVGIGPEELAALLEAILDC